MALIRRMNRIFLEANAPHTEATATYAIVRDDEGQLLLQIDSYGSTGRQMPGKKSQSLRFSSEALDQLAEILRTELER